MPSPFGSANACRKTAIDAQVVDALDQLVEIFGLLLRIGIVEVVEIDVRHPHDLPVLYLRQLLGELVSDGLPATSMRGTFAGALTSPARSQRQRHAVTVLARAMSSATPPAAPYGQTHTRGALPVAAVMRW